MAKKKRGEWGKPWHRQDRDLWQVRIDGIRHTLTDQHGNYIRGKDNGAAAEQAFYRLMAARDIPSVGDNNEVRMILDLYLQDMERREVSPKTFKNYQGFFASFLKRHPRLLVKDLRPAHIQEWWKKSHPQWGASSRNLSGSAFKAAMRWAALPGKGGAIIPKNPLDGMELPTMRKRSSDVVVTEAEFQRLMSLVKSEEVRNVLVVAWQTGTRPVNICRATAANLADGGNSLLFADWNTPAGSAVHKTFAKTGRPLVVPLTDAAKEICLGLARKRPEGELFRSPTGLPWTDVRLATLIMHYAKRAGLEGRFTAYSCRHTRATTLLEQGHSDSDVAAILGNTPGVIHRNYSHVAAKTNRLRDLLNKSQQATEI
ncbi:tyrosine-type recombinase/integrase [Zavarzinella formosa]|uniref:tyrosine-type recombinase/integrase n=1 Tax=Zavarzinella formosa TaxID=360055 RepID=UPI0002EB59BE|nr:tyrosine-type recombinase/integrase [Zavarzinella formosa]